jgi:class 3 adenylate cyclase
MSERTPVKPTGSLSEKLERKRELEREQFAMMKDLYAHYRNGTFLSVDIVGSTRLKEGEDSLKVIHTFQAFHRFVHDNIYGSLGSVFSGDGVMCLFGEAAEAVNAGTRILQGLEKFNREESRLDRWLNVRIGINTGTILVDETAEMGLMSERHIDIAGHLQKYGEPGGILISAVTWGQIENRDDFVKCWKTIDNVVVYRYRHNVTPLGEQSWTQRLGSRIARLTSRTRFTAGPTRTWGVGRAVAVGLAVLVLMVLALGAYIRWQPGDGDSTRSLSSAQLLKHRLQHVRSGQRLKQPHMQVDRKTVSLPEQLFLVIPAGQNTRANKRNGVAENQVVMLQRNASGEYRAVRMGFLDTPVEIRNGYWLFFDRNDAERCTAKNDK